MLLSQWVMAHIRLLFLLWGLAALTTLSSDFLLGHHMILLRWCVLIVLALFFDKFLGGLRRALRAGSLARHVQVFDVAGVLAHALVADPVPGHERAEDADEDAGGGEAHHRPGRDGPRVAEFFIPRRMEIYKWTRASRTPDAF